MGAVKLEEDSGRYFRDANAARHPSHPMEPAVKAVIAHNPQIDTGDVDIFACTSTLGNLLRFLKNDDKTFRFTVEAVGHTVFFVRRENAPDELIAGPRGYGPTGHGTKISFLLMVDVLSLTMVRSQATHFPSGTRAGRRALRTLFHISASFPINSAA